MQNKVYILVRMTDKTEQANIPYLNTMYGVHVHCIRFFGTQM